MRQQVNLFQGILRPKHVQWSSKQLLKIIVVVIGLMLVAEAVGVWQTLRMKRALANAEQSLETKKAELTKVELQYPRPQEDQRLVVHIQQLNEELRQKQQILEILNEGGYGNSQGFADHLTGLSRQHIEGIWLTHLSIKQGGKQLGLTGGSLRPELVPQFLQRLSKERSFAGREFKTLLLTRAEKTASWINFDLNTEDSGDVKP